MHSLLTLVAFLATQLLDADPGGDPDLEGTDGDQNADEPEELPLDERLVTYGKFKGWSPEVAAVEDGTGYEAIATKLSELDTPEAKGLLEELTQREETERAAAEEAERQRLAADDEALKQRIRVERDQKRAQEQREQAEAERRARLAAEVEAEERAAAGTPPDPDEEHLATLQAGSDAAQAWRRGELSIEEAHEAAQKGIEAAARLKGGPEFRVDVKALDEAVEARLAELRKE